mmetsp:Transcript_59151/g.70579  ORF Transcript_59151/g.70579 Transcript_59151/m.70579 type:complete len:416 (+) Transcript_59151:41-1288(+)
MTSNQSDSAAPSSSLHKYLKSTYSSPGQRIIHPGFFHDFPPNHDANLVFGKRLSQSDHVEDIFSSGQKTSTVEKVKTEWREGITTSKHVLGKSLTRGHVLPAAVTRDTFRHGLVAARTEYDAKSLLYPQRRHDNGRESERDQEPHDAVNYIKSHGSYRPGEQKRRDYKWPVDVDPVTTTFGIRGHDASGRASGRGVFMALHFDDNVDNDNDATIKTITAAATTKTTNAVPPETLVFGKKTRTSSETTAKDCLTQNNNNTKDNDDDDKTNTTTANQKGDDLGRSLRPGFRNAVTAKRQFGCPSIRTDIPKYTRRSVADTQNYGDDVSASYLLRPSLFSNNGGLAEDEFDKARGKDEIRSLFRRCGYGMEDEEVFERLWEAATAPAAEGGLAEECSVNAFRREYNDWLLGGTEGKRK